jgi:hypothetical protein
MIKKTSSFLLILFFLSQSCSDPATETQTSLSRDQVLEDVKTWFSEKPGSGAKKNKRDLSEPLVAWGDAKIFRRGLDKFVISAPVLNYSRTGRSTFQLIVFRDNDKVLAGFIVEVIPDQAYIKKEKRGRDRNFSGQVKILTASGKRIKTQKFVEGHEVDFYSENTSTLRTATGEDDWWDDGEPIYLDEVEIIAESWENDTYYVWIDDPWWDDYGTDWDESDNWDDSWIYDDYNGDGNMDMAIPSPVPASPPEVINNIKDPCVKNVASNLTNTSVANRINEIINDVFADTNNKVNLILNEDNTQNVPARTQVTSTGDPFNVTITLNSDMLSNSSQEYIAAIVYHEAIHAYLDQSGYSQNQLEQHVEIAENYISALQDALLELFPSLPTQDAIGLGLRGLGDLMDDNPAYWNNLINGLGYDTNAQLIQDTDAYRNSDTGTACN